jgi:hypothetical protein
MVLSRESLERWQWHSAIPEPQPPVLALMDETPEAGRLSAQKRGMLLDDVPQSIKKSKVGVTQLLHLVMFLAQGNQEDSWLRHGELDGLSSLTGYKVTGARVHSRPRRRTFEHERFSGTRHLTLMCPQDNEGVVAWDDVPEVARKSRKMPGSWTGLTLFYEERPRYGVLTQVRYVDTPVGLLELALTQTEAEDVQDIFETWGGFVERAPIEEDALRHAFVLKLKNNMKELDQKSFDRKERQVFDEADVAEWRQWLASGAVEVVPGKEESKVARELIFTAPMRFLRTNKSRQPDELIAKSRLIIPGHMDPQLGLYRTDAPTTSGLAVLVVATLAAGRGWYLRFFDVSGKEMGRTVYVRGPVDGLPAVGKMQRVPPYRLLKILKGAYGLTEAPRLWYVRARELMIEIGFAELCCARAVFVLRDKEETVAMLTLHVDDGLLAGDEGNQRYLRAVKEINSKFKIKEWHDLKKGTANYLGMRWKQEDRGVTLDMDEYIGNLTAMELKKAVQDGAKLDDGTVHMFRGTLAKVRWPVSHVVPEMAYAMSSVAQVGPTALTWEQVRQLSLVVMMLKKMVQAGQARIVLPKMRGDQVTVVTPFDASFAKEPGLKSQAGFLSFLTTGDVTKGEVPGALVELQSTTISRVVKSTLATESVSLSTALDRQVYLRLLVQSLLRGEPTYAGLAAQAHHPGDPGDGGEVLVRSLEHDR